MTGKIKVTKRTEIEGAHQQGESKLLHERRTAIAG
jgi:hypothetical protein